MRHSAAQVFRSGTCLRSERLGWPSFSEPYPGWEAVNRGVSRESIERKVQDDRSQGKLSSSAKAGDPVSRGFSIQSRGPLEYWFPTFAGRTTGCVKAQCQSRSSRWRSKI